MSGWAFGFFGASHFSLEHACDAPSKESVRTPVRYFSQKFIIHGAAMHTPKHQPIRIGSCLLGAALLLSSCGTAIQTPAQPDTFTHVHSVDISASDTITGVETRTNSKVITWHPEEGYAVIGNQSPTPANTVDLTAVTNTTSTSNLKAVLIAEGRAATFAGGRAATFAGGNQIVNAFINNVSTWGTGWFGYTANTPYPTASGQNMNALTGSSLAILFGYGDGGIRLPKAQTSAPKLGKGIKVAVIDTGVDLEHPGLKGVAGDATQPPHLAPSTDWKDFVDGDAIPQEVFAGTGAGYGHGTGVAGVILQIAPYATIMPIRVLDGEGAGDVSTLIQAIEWAVNHGAKVINLSLGTYEPVDALRKTINWASGKGVYIVASAGNDNTTNATYPAADAKNSAYGGTRLISVGSVGSGNLLGQLLGDTSTPAAPFDQKSLYSNQGSNVELYAPGEMITTLLPNALVGNWTGSSFAAPMVSGALALALAEPLNNTQSGRVSTAITSTGVSLNTSLNTAWAGQLTGGRLDTAAFMQKVLTGK